MSSNIHFISFNIINIVSEKPTFKCMSGQKHGRNLFTVTKVFYNQFKDHIYGKLLHNEMFPKSNLR